MQLAMEQRISIAKSYYEIKSYNEVQANLRSFCKNVYHQIKPQFEKMLKSMKGMAYLLTWIKEDHRDELPQEHRKTLKRYSKH